MTLHRHYGYPLWWGVYVAVGDWALPLRIMVRPRLIDGSGRREHVASVELSVLCVHCDVHYAWGRRRYRPAAAEVLSLRQVLENDLAWRLTLEPGPPHNDA